MRRLTTMRRGNDRGAMAILIAVIVPVVLLGMGAFVVDVGSWYSERAQTQNGADAGAVAVAQSCAAGHCATSMAGPYAPANSTGNLDTSATVSSGFPCGRSGTQYLPSCAANVENGVICPKPLSGTKNYVDVQVTTSKAMTPLFGSLLGGSAKTIGACAQATWGPPASVGNAVPLTISACEWLKNTANGTVFATAPTGSYASGGPYRTSPPSYLATLNTRRSDPAYDTTPGVNSTNFYVTNHIKDPHSTPLNAPVAGSETVITTHGFGNNCAQGTPGTTAPGQFSWLSKGSCTVAISGPTYVGSTGNSPPACEPVFAQSMQTKTPIYLPVYTSVTASGANTTYTLDGFAAFVVTGWDVNQGGWGGPNSAASAVALADSTVRSADANYCGPFTGSPSDVCIYGYFTKALIPPSQVPSGPGGPNLGATYAYLTG
jgi:Flp pilus assembly protein TadG